MTTITNNQTVAVATAADGANIYLSSSGSLITSASAVTSTHDSVGYLIDGIVYSTAGAGIEITGATTSNNLVVGLGGSVTGLTFAINAEISASMITNNGTISGFEGGIYIEGEDNSITNNGSINTVSGYAVEFVATGNHLNITNTGNISSNDGGVKLSDYVELVNTGTIHADGHGIYGGNYNTVNNTGTIEGGTAMSFTGSGNTVFNHGRIGGVSSTLIAFSSSSGSNDLYNYGEIYTSGAAVNCYNGGAINIYNRGVITGLIFLSTGNDYYDGRGGVLQGEITDYGGDDVYVTDDAGFEVSESDGGGSDEIRSTVSFKLSSVRELENLTLIGGDDTNGTGNSLDNVLTGNLGDNMLKGRDGDDTLEGGEGADVMNGGSGADTVTYSASSEGVEVNLAKDTAADGDADGDTFVSIERIRGSEENDSLHGDSASNVFWGSGGDDLLDGKGGDDTLYGGDGDDVYIVDSSADVVDEQGYTGIDTVKSSVSYALDATGYIELLVLTGSRDIDGTGNDAANHLTSNTGDNKLAGLDGNDRFVFLKNFGHDTITDFAIGDDVVKLTDLSNIITSFGDLKKHHAADVGSNVEIDAGGGDVIVLRNIDLADLSASSFDFS